MKIPVLFKLSLKSRNKLSERANGLNSMVLADNIDISFLQKPSGQQTLTYSLRDFVSESPTEADVYGLRYSIHS